MTPLEATAPAAAPPQDAGAQPTVTPAPVRKLDRKQMALEAAAAAMPQRAVVPGSQQPAAPPPGDPKAYENWINVNDPSKLKQFHEHVFKNPGASQQEYIKLFSQQTDEVKLRDYQRFQDTLNIMNQISNGSQILSNITEEGAFQSAMWQGATGFFGTTAIADKMDKDFLGALTQVDAEGNVSPVTGADGKPLKNGQALDMAALHVAKMDALGLGHLVDKSKRDIIKSFDQNRNYAGQVRGVVEMYGLGKVTSGLGGALIKGAEEAGATARLAENQMKALTTKLGQATGAAEKTAIQGSIDALKLQGATKPFWTGPATVAGKALERLGGARGGHFSRTVLPMVELEGVAGGFAGAREYGDNAARRAAAGAWDPQKESLQDWQKKSGSHLLERVGAVAGGAAEGGWRGMWSGIGFWIPSALMGAAGRRIMPRPVSEADLYMAQNGGFKVPMLERIFSAMASHPVTGSMIRAPANMVKQAATFYTGNNIGHFLAEMMTGGEPTAFKTGDFATEMIGAGAFGALFGGAETIAWRNQARKAATLGSSPAAKRAQIESVERLSKLIYTKPRHREWITNAIDNGFPVDKMSGMLADIASGGIDTQAGLAKVGLAVQKHFALKNQGPQAPKPQASTRDVRFFDRFNEARRQTGEKPLTSFDDFDAEMRQAALVHSDAAGGRDPVAFEAGEKLRALYEQDAPLTPEQHTQLLEAEATLRARATPAADVEVGTAEHTANIRSMLSEQLEAAKTARRVAAATPGQMIHARTASIKVRNIAEKIAALDRGEISEALQNEYLAYLGQQAPGQGAPQAQARGWQAGAQPVGRGGGPPAQGPAAPGAAAPGAQPGAQPPPPAGLVVNPAAPGAPPTPGAVAPGAAAPGATPPGATAPTAAGTPPVGAPSAGTTPAKSPAAALGTPAHAASVAALHRVFPQGQANWKTATRASVEAAAQRLGKTVDEVITLAMRDLDLAELHNKGGFGLIESELTKYADSLMAPGGAAAPAGGAAPAQPTTGGPAAPAPQPTPAPGPTPSPGPAPAGGAAGPTGPTAPPPKKGRAKQLPLKNHADAMRFVGAQLNPDQLKYVSESKDPDEFRSRLNEVALDPKTDPKVRAGLRTILADKLIGKSMDKPASPHGEAETPPPSGSTAPSPGPAPAPPAGGAAPAAGPAPAAPTGDAAGAQTEINSLAAKLDPIITQLKNPKLGNKQRLPLMDQARALQEEIKGWHDAYPETTLPAGMAPPKTQVERATTAPEAAKPAAPAAAPAPAAPAAPARAPARPEPDKPATPAQILAGLRKKQAQEGALSLSEAETTEAISALAAIRPEPGREGTQEGNQIALMRAAAEWHRDTMAKAAEAAQIESNPEKAMKLAEKARDSLKVATDWEAKLAEAISKAPPAKPVVEEPAPAKPPPKPKATVGEAENIALELAGEANRVNIHDFVGKTNWSHEEAEAFLNEQGYGAPPPAPEGAEAPPGFVAGMRKQAEEAHRTISPEGEAAAKIEDAYNVAAAAYYADPSNIDKLKAATALHDELAKAKAKIPDIYTPPVKAPVGGVHSGVYEMKTGGWNTTIWDKGTNKWHLVEYDRPIEYPEGGTMTSVAFLDQPTAEAYLREKAVKQVHPESLDRPALPSKGPPPPPQPTGAEKADVQMVEPGTEVLSPGQVALFQQRAQGVPQVRDHLAAGDITRAKETWDQMPFGPEKRDSAVLIQAHETGERMLAFLEGTGEKKKDQQPRLRPTLEQVKRIREILEGRYLPHMDIDPRTELPAPVTLKPEEQAYVLSNEGWEESIKSFLSPQSRAAKNLKDDAVYREAVRVFVTGGGLPWAPREGEKSGQAIVRNNWPPRRRNRQTGVMEQIMNRSYNKRFESTSGGRALTYTEETLKQIREGTFKESDKETAATSMLRLLHSIHEQNGIVTPGDVMRSIFTIHGPMVPEILVRHTLRGSKFGSSAANARLMRKGLLVDLGLGEIAKNKKGQPIFDPKEDLVTPGHLDLFYPPEVVEKFGKLLESKDPEIQRAATETITRMWNEAYDKDVKEWEFKVLEAATSLPYEARKGSLAGTYFEHLPDLINSYLGYARAGAAEGYNIFNLIGAKEGTYTPRSAWLNLIANEPYSKRGTLADSKKAESQLQDLFGFESPDDGYMVTMDHLFPDKGQLDHLVRAYEVLNDVGTPSQLMAGEVLNNTLTTIVDPEHKGLMDYEMPKERAKLIVEAFESGKVELMRDVLRLGDTVASEVRLPGEQRVAAGEEARSIEEDFKFSRDPNNPMSWSIRPNEPAFKKMLDEVETKTPEVIENLPAWRQALTMGTQSVGSLGLPEAKKPTDPNILKLGEWGGFEDIRHYANTTPKDIEQALKDLQKLPYDVINSAEMIRDAKLYDLKAKQAREAGNLEEAQLLQAEARDLYMRSETAMASAVERALWEGESELKILEMMADFDTFSMKGELGTEVGVTQRSWTKMLVGEMHARGWMVDVEGNHRLSTSERMTHLVTRIAHLRGRAFTNKFAERHAANMREHGENPLTWICHSSCVRNYEAIKEWADELPEKLKIVGQRMKKLWSENRDNITNAVATWGRQIVDPHAKEINTSLISKITATNRNRVGDVLSNTLSKYNIEKDAAMIDLVAGYQGVLGKHGFTALQPILHERPAWDELTPVQQQEQLELRQLLRVLDGRPGATQANLSARAKNALPEMRQFLLTMKRNMAEHLFSAVTEAAKTAIAEGTSMPRWVLRRWSRLLGGTTDPKKVLDILKHTIEADPTLPAQMIHGVQARGWGLKQYYPHIWRSSQKVGDAFTHQRDPGQSADADMLTDHWVSGEKIATWKKEFVEDYARTHGFIGNHKRMSNMLERLGDKDGYIEDLHYTMQSYVGRMVEKVYWERLTKDLNPMIFGDWQKVDTTSSDQLKSWLSNVPWESKDSHHALLGGVDQHFGIRLTGQVMSAGYRLLTKDGIIKPESKAFGKAQRHDASKRWRRDIWRVADMNLDHWDATDPKLAKKVKLELSNGSERLVLWGKKAIERAGLEVRKGGMTNYKEGTQFAAISKVIREATGFDVDSMRHVGPGKEGAIGKAIRNVADVTSEFIYQTQLGGYINTKAASVQMLEGIIQNFSALGWGPMKDFMPHMKGGLKFIHDTLISGDPIAARERLKVERAGSEYVDKVLPVLEAGRMQVSHLLGTEAKGGLLKRASRISYAGFSTADVFTKEMAYYAAYKRAVEVGQWKDPETGRQLKVTPDYIGVGEQHKRFSDEISAHDIARMVVERTHFTLPKWAQPGIVKMPGWSFFGHLGTQATNITAEFWYGLNSMGKYLKTGDPVHAFAAKKAGQYMAAMGLAMGLASFLGRDIGAYVGQHPKDVGFDEYKLGKLFPFLDVLPNWVRIPAWQPPNEMSLPAKLWFGPKPEEGILPTIGDAMLRRMSGEQTLGQGMESAFGNWWNHNSRTITGRVVRPLSQLMTHEPSDLDPERPNQVRDPWWMGPEQKTRYRSDFDLYFGDLFLPGWSQKDSSEQQRTLWANQLTGVRSKIGKELRQKLRSTNPEIVEDAYRELQDRGFKVDGWRQRKAAQMDQLPSNIRLALGHGDRVTKLKTFALLGEDWDPAFRQLALKWILPENRRPNLKDLPPGLWDQVQAALDAP